MDDAQTYLDQLAAELERRGWQVSLRSDGRLKVTNPAHADLNEVIGCRELNDGWRFTWPWHEPIGGVDDVAEVADRIAHVLREIAVEGGVGGHG
jgi:hypothetical protein